MSDAPVPWLATAYVAGPSLAETIDNHGPLSARSAVSLAAGLAEGLNAIHAAGVVHGDLKPSNVLLSEDGPRVIDFGISRAADAAPLTHPGLVMGSPGFMSPEQAMGRETGPRSDVFSLGAVLAYASTGDGPFGTGSAVVRLDRVINGEPDLEKVPDELQALVRRCLEKDMAKRPTAADVLADVGAKHFGTDWLPSRSCGCSPRTSRSATPGCRISRRRPWGATQESAGIPPVPSAAQTPMTGPATGTVRVMAHTPGTRHHRMTGRASPAPAQRR